MVHLANKHTDKYKQKHTHRHTHGDTSSYIISWWQVIKTAQRGTWIKIWTWQSEKCTHIQELFCSTARRFRTWDTDPEGKTKNLQTTHEFVSLLGWIKPNTVPAGLKWAGASSYNRRCRSSNVPPTGWIPTADWTICGLHHSRKTHPSAWKIHSWFQKQTDVERCKDQVCESPAWLSAWALLSVSCCFGRLLRGKKDQQLKHYVLVLKTCWDSSSCLKSVSLLWRSKCPLRTNKD